METYLTPLIGGVLIGLGSVIALAASGKIPGISGVVGRLLRPTSGDSSWRVLFLVGLISGAGLIFFNDPWWSKGFQDYTVPEGRTALVFAIAGLLVGFGTRLGGGCTSGHGVCGIGSGARDGLVYTLVFMATAVATVWFWNLLNSGGVAS